jgi:hypothetical protein
LPPWLQPTYVLDASDPDILMLCRSDGSFVAAFSVRGATREGILEAAEEDWRQRNRLVGEPGASSKSRDRGEADPNENVGWEEFLKLEQRALEDRRRGQLGQALGQPLPGESREEADRLVWEYQRGAEEGLVKVLQEGERLFKHVDELAPDDVPGRTRAERARKSWIEARQERR